MSPIEALVWPLDRAGEALELTARRAKLRVKVGDAGRPPESARSIDRIGGWLALTAERLELEVEPAECAYRDLDRMLGAIGPALVPVEGGLLALLESAGGALRAVGPDGRVHRIAREAVRSAVGRAVDESPRVRALEELLPRRRHEAAVRRIATELFGSIPVGPLLMIRPHPSASFASHAPVLGGALVLIAAHVAQTATFVLSWWLLGRAALGGELDPAWLFAWALALATTVPLAALVSRSQARLAIVLGRVVKKRLLHGALALSQDEMRRQGAGDLLARVLESTEVELAGVSGSLASALAVIELGVAAVAMGAGAGGSASVVAFAGYVLFTLVAIGILYRRSASWTDSRLAMTNDLIERMVGHRTRLVQEDRSRTEEEEDRVLESYLERSRAFDRSSVMLSSLPRGWVLAGVLALAPAFVAGTTTASLAIAIGGVLLGLSALTSLSNGLAQLASAAVAARRLRPLLAAASRHARAGDIASIGSPALDPRGAELQVRGVGYRHEGRERAVLRDCDLVLRAGDRILLEGPSGGGKSTFGALVGGLRDPSDGVILLDGLDRHSLGAHGWRERVVLSPQFHENHVLGHSFAFNALLGSEWPPTGASLDRLSAICEELGLGPLLARMPAGLEQSVGDSGWQLSHGERARLYLARVLAQEGPGLWILDETFAALDPITRERCLDAVLARAPTLVVVSHR